MSDYLLKMKEFLASDAEVVLVRVVPETVFDVSIVFFDEHATVFLIEEYFSLRCKKAMEW